ncbi:ABC transporter permease [Paenibacillus koleovorans]|uniref:ABC transporter permease n=1 Tax=Paenibacillus koleovorans TaxID=121608 RepID=UPI000FD8B4D7|nr:ABC transporter permease subunit [Paenibacillus koleovorans]
MERSETTATTRLSTWRQVKRMKLLYLLLLLPVVQLFIFQYIPMYGVLIAFKDFKVARGIWDSPWNNFEHFRTLFSDFIFLRALRNTLIISGLKLVFGFLAPIVFALLLNEIRHVRFKKITQSISYLPHFMSWVIAASMLVEIVSPQRGIVNYVITLFGGDPVHFLASKTYFVPMLIISDIWKEMGWAAIIYIASMASISPELYEASDVDGANRLQKMVHITIPAIMPVVVILFLLRLGNILEGGFDQILNLYNPLVYEVGDIIDTYVYRVGLVEYKFDYSAAVGLFKNVVGVVLLVTANLFVRKVSDHGAW